MNSYIILFIIVAYFGILLLIAWITGRKSSSNEAFFLGNRKSPWYIVSIGMVGTSLSGVTFVSVPGMVRSIDMTYMQTVLGFFFGYILIAKVLLPLYYKLQLTSIYSYLDDRIGQHSYKTGASFFLLFHEMLCAVPVSELEDTEVLAGLQGLHHACKIQLHLVFHLPDNYD